MTHPTGDALLARIKELEEALRTFADIKDFSPIGDGPIDYCYIEVKFECLRAASKVLNK